MDNLQYNNEWLAVLTGLSDLSFKPYYKWITFNTIAKMSKENNKDYSFKPYYKWITFNTFDTDSWYYFLMEVLNLIING